MDVDVVVALDTDAAFSLTLLLLLSLALKSSSVILPSSVLPMIVIGNIESSTLLLRLHLLRAGSTSPPPPAKLLIMELGAIAFRPHILLWN